jgi:hypothetical protein
MARLSRADVAIDLVDQDQVLRTIMPASAIRPSSATKPPAGRRSEKSAICRWPETNRSRWLHR